MFACYAIANMNAAIVATTAIDIRIDLPLPESLRRCVSLSTWALALCRMAAAVALLRYLKFNLGTCLKSGSIILRLDSSGSNSSYNFLAY